LVGLTKVISLETAGTGITANCIAPGWVRTSLVEKQIEANAAAKNISIEESTKDLVKEKMPSQQMVQADHIGALVVFLCSDAAQQITGQCLPIDGGWTVQ